MYPRLAARARQATADGFATATIELPGCGDRPRWPAVERARAELRRALRAGEPVTDEIADALVSPLVDRSVPEWRAALDALLALPGIGGPVGYSGGVISLGIRLALAEPRISAAVLFAGSLVPRAVFEEARRVTVPLHVLLQWDDEGNDRQAALDLFDAFGSREKTLHATTGGHTGVPGSRRTPPPGSSSATCVRSPPRPRSGRGSRSGPFVQRAAPATAAGPPPSLQERGETGPVRSPTGVSLGRFRRVRRRSGRPAWRRGR